MGSSIGNMNDSLATADEILQQILNSKYTAPEDMSALKEKILNQEEFKYNPAADPTYMNYAKQYAKNAKLGMKDTLGAAAGLTGGYNNSYAQTAAQQVYDSTMQELANLIPDLEQNAYGRYRDEIGDDYNQYNLLEGINDDAYTMYQNDVNNKYNEFGIYNDAYRTEQGRQDTIDAETRQRGYTLEDEARQRGYTLEDEERQRQYALEDAQRARQEQIEAEQRAEQDQIEAEQRALANEMALSDHENSLKLSSSYGGGSSGGSGSSDETDTATEIPDKTLGIILDAYDTYIPSGDYKGFVDVLSGLVAGGKITEADMYSYIDIYNIPEKYIPGYVDVGWYDNSGDTVIDEGPFAGETYTDLKTPKVDVTGGVRRIR